jgi:hypothetical protein
MNTKLQKLNAFDLVGSELKTGRSGAARKSGSAGLWLIRAAQEIAYRWRQAVNGPSRERAAELERERKHEQRLRLADEYAKGYLEGWHECYVACVDAVEEETSRNSELWAAGELLAETEGSLKLN